jgi:TPP-dependent indolepyruvate ferredoxin oxidoreductase alpha subunit
MSGNEPRNTRNQDSEGDSFVIRILSGNEAVARGAWEAGVAVASAYPGTPSTEILEEFVRFPSVYAEWATNEKVAMDVAIGAAYSGSRRVAGAAAGALPGLSASRRVLCAQQAQGAILASDVLVNVERRCVFVPRAPGALGESLTWWGSRLRAGCYDS